VSKQATSRWQERAVTAPVATARERALTQSLKFVQAALELLGESDRADLTVTEVVERAGVSLRTFYQRFGSKDELMLAVLEESQHYGRDLRQAALDAASDPSERLRMAVSGLLAEVPPHARSRRAALARENLRLAQMYPEEIQQLAEPTIELLTHEIERGIAAGLVRDDDPRALALMVYHLTSAHMVASLLETVDTKRSPLDAEQIGQFILRALRPDPTPPTPTR
jgi:AcrR family transcriptional regulator